MLNNIPSCKIFNAVLESKRHLSPLFINPKTVFKQRLLKGETINFINSLPRNIFIFMSTICVTMQLFCDKCIVLNDKQKYIKITKTKCLSVKSNKLFQCFENHFHTSESRTYFMKLSLFNIYFLHTFLSTKSVSYHFLTY